MAVKQSELLDLIATTLPDLPEQYFEVTWDNQDYEFCRIYQTERMQIDGGTSIVRKVFLSPTGNARYRRAYDTDEPAVGDVMHTITVPWTRIGTNYSWDEFEILQNKNSAKGFINLLTVRRIDGLWDLANLIEERAWKTPTDADDDLYPYGVPYYLRMLDAGSTSDGFNAKTIRYQNGSVGTVCAGINSGTQARWKNYAAIYTAIDNSMLRKFRLAFLYTNFKAPLFVNDPAQKKAAAKRIYTDFDNVADLMDLADAKDDNHSGKDVLGNLRVDDGGLVTVNRLPVVGIPQLNSVTDPVKGTATKPVYCIDFAKFVPFVHDGYWMKESEPMSDRTAHTTFSVFLDGAHNNLCTNVRAAGFVLHKAIPA